MRVRDRVELSAESSGVGANNLQSARTRRANPSRSAGDHTRKQNRGVADNYA
jgi:hypothetical protein